jgi:pimeloyl-ACP methyl ester carboxylesterase
MQFMPGGTLEQWQAFDELQRRTSSPTNAVRIMGGSHVADVADVAKQLRVPTLVVHARDDVRAPVVYGRELATLIPGSQFVLLESSNHLLLGDEPAWTRFLEAVESFLAEVS